MKDFFISYTQADRQWAEWIAWMLEEEKYSTVLQAWDFLPGCNFLLEMDKAAKEAKRTILVLSPDFLESQFTAPEWAAAFVQDPTGKEGKLLPIRVRDCNPKGLLGPINRIEIVGLNEEDAKRTLLKGVSSERSKPKSQPIFPGLRSVSEQPIFPGELPELGDLPQGSRLPFPRNAVFTGRKEDLLELSRILLHSSANGVGVTQEAAITAGFGGIGKTQLAVEFCYRYGRFFQGVHWIHANQDIPAEIAACGLAMALPDWPDKPSEQVAFTLKAWQEGNPRLVVLDNIGNPSTVQEWMPQLSNCRLLLTSRQSDWPTDLGLKTWPLNILPRPLSKELLCKLAPRLGKVPDEEVNDIADRLGDLPLALDLAGRYLADRPGMSPVGYLKALNEASNALEHSSLNDWVKHSPTKHATNMAFTFSLSWDQLARDEVDRLARRVFRACGYCAPNVSIPLYLLEKTMGSSEILDRALGRLSSLGLIIPTERGPSLHLLLAEFARIQDKDAEESILPFLADTLGNLVYQANETDLSRQMKPLHEHLQFVAQASYVAGLPVTGLLWNELGYNQAILAEYNEARKNYEKALDADERVYVSDHLVVAVRANNLSRALRDLGDFEGAKNCLKRALKIEEKFYGPHHPGVAIILNNLGSVLQAIGNYIEAKKNYERALEIDKKILGADHPELAIVLNNLGSLLYDMGDYEGAKKNYERAFEIDEKIFGADHSKIATRLSNLGSVMQKMHDFERAKKNY
ncbi:MAG: toll/interleukin-1 receptor domain-containing protein, partial [Methanothrix sp.]